MLRALTLAAMAAPAAGFMASASPMVTSCAASATRARGLTAVQVCPLQCTRVMLPGCELSPAASPKALGVKCGYANRVGPVGTVVLAPNPRSFQAAETMSYA